VQVNGRKARWASHRENRRIELIQAAIEAVMEHGPEVDMDQVAKAAGITKPVLYRYFADKAQLWLAVGEHVAQQVLAVVEPAIEQVREERELIAATIDAYLGAIESQEELYRFLMRQQVPGVHHLINGAAQTVSSGLSRVIGDRLRAVGLDAGPAEPWAIGIVGLVQAVGDWWMRRNRPLGRQALVEYLTTLLWEGIAGVKAAADLPLEIKAVSDAV
jgi:AcrR family transcriptional regulator